MENNMEPERLERLRALQGKPAALPSNGVKIQVGDYQKHKDAQIAKSVALNCAAQLTEAYAHIIAATDMVKTMTEPQIKGWLKSIKITELNENIKFLTDKENDEIPF